MFSNTFKALSDPVRLNILDMLRKKGSMKAGDIAAEFNLTNATISYHLKILKTSDLIYERREKNFIFYELNTSIFEDMLSLFIKFRGEQNEKQN